MYRVSVIIIAYSQAKNISESLNGILKQSAAAGEILVLNDGSADHLNGALSPILYAILGKDSFTTVGLYD